MNEKNITYSETFFSAQGEGQYIGIPSLWLRLFACNLQCNGFGQDDPTDPSTYDLPYERIDINDISQVEDLPVFSKGCDSSYTWSKKYKHLMREKSAADLAAELKELLPTGSFTHSKSGQPIHMVFTGGEPMLKRNQVAMLSVLQELEKQVDRPKFVTVETNGTQPVGKDLALWIQKNSISAQPTEWFWSVSPKLWSTAGEKPTKAIKPEIVAKYADGNFFNGQLKFVVNGSQQSWQEVADHTAAFRDAGVDWPVWIMGVGGTVEGLKLTEADIADEAIQLGYNYTSRVHCHIYGNAIGK